MKSLLGLTLLLLLFSFSSCDWPSSSNTQDSGIAQKVKPLSTKEIQEFLIQENLNPVKKGPSQVDLTYQDLQGNSKSLKELKGKIILLNLWATYCKPCLEEMPDLENLYYEMKGKNFALVAISVGEEAEKVKGFLEKYPYSFPIGLDPQSQFVQKLDIHALPTTFLFDSTGVIVGQALGSRKWKNANFIRFFQSISMKSKE